MWNWIKKYFLLLAVTLFMLGIVVYYFVRHWQPYTQNAFLVANTRPVSVLVPGYLTHVHVLNNQFVKANQPLFTVFQPPYQLRVAQLQANIADLVAQKQALQDKIMVLEAEVTADTAKTANAEYLANRAMEMYEGEAVSQAYAEEMVRAFEAEKATLAATRAAIPEVKSQIVAVEARIAGLQSELELAEIYLEQTVITALADGLVINMYVSPGGYYTAGATLCAFVDTSAWWVQANFEETDLSRIQPGQKADIWLWQYPGKTFHGTVDAIGWGVERRLTSGENGAPVVVKENQWFLLPQRFPVQIRIDDPDAAYPFHLGGSAYVRIHTSAQLLKQIFWRLWQW